MAILKCKMCGGDIVVNDEKTFGTCEYCGSTMTLPKVSDDQRAARFNRGNHFRRQGDFDKALAVYESIVREDDTDAEAHWCCALCRFGIEYVEDPNTYEFLPTCHRASFDSFTEDVDYLAALENSDGITKRQYQKDAAKIAEVQRGILATSQNEEPYDVFICYKETDDQTKERTRDSLDAQDIYYQLTQEGYRVFFSRITLEDKVGAEYEPYIFAALNSAKVMIAIGSKPEYFNAVWVKNEWSRFLAMMRKDRSKLLLPCYKGMDPYDLPEQLGVLQSYDMAKIGFMQDLIRGVKKVLTKDEKKQTEVVQQTVVQQSGGNVDTLLERINLFLEDEEWESAEEYCQKALDIDPKNAEAYLGLTMVKGKSRNKESFSSAYIDGRISSDDKNLRRAKQFGDEKLSAWLNEIDKQRKEKEKRRAERKRQQEEKRKAEEEKRKAEEEQKRAESRKRLAHLRERIPQYSISVSAGWEHTVGLRSDGTVLAVGNNKYGQCDVECWTDIVAIAAGYDHTLGLKADGTVVATGLNDNGQCNVQGWTDIVHISAGQNYTVGLKKTDGSVVAVGVNDRGQCDVQSWNDIVAISVGRAHTVGLKSDGTVAAVGDDDFDQCDVSAWTDIVAISAGNMHTVGLKSDGTVVAIGDNDYGQCNVTYWKGIAAVVAGSFNTIGLKEDGSVIATKVTGDIEDYHGQCDVQGWKDVVSVSTKGWFAVGLKSNNTVVAVGNNDEGQCNISNWKLLRTEEEKKAEEEKARQQRIATLNTEKANLQTELANLKGIFSGRRRKEIEARLAQIENELKSL